MSTPWRKRPELKVRSSLFALLQSRMLLIFLFVVLQMVLVVVLINWVSQFLPMLTSFLIVISALVVGYIMTRDSHPSYKLVWVVIVLLMPVFGGIFYLIFGTRERPILRRSREKRIEHDPILPETWDPRILDELDELDDDAGLQARYVLNQNHEPVYRNTQTRYFPSGEESFDSILQSLASAERYILIESFIVEQGEMLDRMLDVLEERAQAGVEVRFMYDDVGSAIRLPSNFSRYLEGLGINGQPFHPRTMRLTFMLNNRDHRKMIVIDGTVAYTGGINIADEYINVRDRFGYWKDTMLRVEGDAAWSMAVSYLETWDFVAGEKNAPYERYQPERIGVGDDGFVMPYSDNSPITNIPMGKNVYLNVIQDAHSYLWITTPYLILDYEMTEALAIDALSGVDVRIITPGVPDKRLVYEVTRANYEKLLRAGVRIYEYTPGFLHAKQMVSDDKVAVVGTVNFDFRSFYLHFECGIWTYGSSAVQDVKMSTLR